MKTFGSDDYDHADCHSIASSKGSTSTTSNKRRSNHLKKIKKKKFSTMDRTPVDLMDDTNAGNNNNDSKDGLLKTKAGTWPNATRNPTDTASIFNEIDLGDDYGVNLVV